MTSPSATTTAPTVGFGYARPAAATASSMALARLIPAPGAGGSRRLRSALSPVKDSTLANLRLDAHASACTSRLYARGRSSRSKIAVPTSSRHDLDRPDPLPPGHCRHRSYSVARADSVPRYAPPDETALPARRGRSHRRHGGRRGGGRERRGPERGGHGLAADAPAGGRREGAGRRRRGERRAHRPRRERGRRAHPARRRSRRRKSRRTASSSACSPRSPTASTLRGSPRPIERELTDLLGGATVSTEAERHWSEPYNYELAVTVMPHGDPVEALEILAEAGGNGWLACSDDGWRCDLWWSATRDPDAMLVVPGGARGRDSVPAVVRSGPPAGRRSPARRRRGRRRRARGARPH